MSALLPLAILTRNRAAYLDVTLRSLSATTLPEEQPLIVYDDTSDEPATATYLYKDLPVTCGRPWPQNNPQWDAAGLHIVNKRHRVPQGLQGRVRVEPVAAQPLGVVNASCQMICRTFARYPAAQAAIFLQDDVVFNADWYARLTAEASAIAAQRPLGLLAGCRLNRPLASSAPSVLLGNSITAQCVLLTRSAFEQARAWFESRHQLRNGFDNHLCTAIRRIGQEVHLINPAVCQHIGLVSLVRPKIGWRARGKRGRICFEAKPPYVLADAVKVFHA